MKTPNTEIYKYEIPGGQYSNLLAQVKAMGSADQFEEIKHLYKDANDLLGNIVKVTPSSKVVGDMAIFMSKNGLTKDNIMTEGAEVSYPDSVVDYFLGNIGQPEGGFPADLQKIVLKGQKPIEGRAGALLPPADWEAIEKHLHEAHALKKVNPRNVLSYALYPKVYDDYVNHEEVYTDVSKLSSDVFFFGLAKGEETSIEIGEGKDILIKYIDMTEPNTEGIRTLTFEINGVMREIKVLDKHLEVKSDGKLKADKNNPFHLGSSIPGTVSKILVKEGEEVKKNQPLLTVEAMKMETSIVANQDGVIDKIYVKEGEQVNQGDLLVSFVQEG